jgi:hypothetical protein
MSEKRRRIGFRFTVPTTASASITALLSLTQATAGRLAEGSPYAVEFTSSAPFACPLQYRVEPPISLELQSVICQFGNEREVISPGCEPPQDFPQKLFVRPRDVIRLVRFGLKLKAT